MYVADYDKDDPATFKGRDLNTMTAQELYAAFGLDSYTQEFIGHAMALYMNDEYLSQVRNHTCNHAHNSITPYNVHGTAPHSTTQHRAAPHSANVAPRQTTLLHITPHLATPPRQPAVHLVNAVQLYSNSLTNYENAPSPYLYPMYGLGGLPESFSRLAAINGGTFMLNRNVDEILFDADGKVPI